MLTILKYWVKAPILQKHRGFIVASKETGLEVIAEKTKYTVMSLDKDAGLYHNVKTGNKCFESVEKFRYFGTSL
jgi:hypothetical protein